ncbi:hypothetical protein [Phenylobacterium sp.]|uniref:hypothetical protein n=1 Tax=Phenylobacterium sp. TaxID=1871053 RepID=UPI002810B430|nr:hypothetical protein [Phenylobacterium sp.]
MDGSGHVEALGGEAAATKVEERGAPGEGPRALPAAKRMAIAALHAQALRRISREAALAEAAQAYAARLGPSRGSLKKLVSEARAILQFGVAPSVLDDAASLAPDAVLARIETAIRAVNLREVTRARAAALAGGRGGRPTARPTIAYAAVRKLLHLAQAGDPDARAELTAIQDLMGAPPMAHTVHRPAASRRS